MPRLKARIEINAPREHVFAAAEPTKMPEWTIHVKEVAITEGDGRSAGTKDNTVVQNTPRRDRLESVWTDYKPGETWARTFAGYLSGEERMSFTESNGGTAVEWQYNFKPPFGIIGKIAGLLVMGRVVQNNMETSLDNLKEALEL